MPAPDTILRLVEQFRADEAYFLRTTYNETRVREAFINPFFEALGWDVRGLTHTGSHAEVVLEQTLNQDDRLVDLERLGKRPDYAFYLGNTRQFFVEAKKPSESLDRNKLHAFQVRAYGWSASLPISILTDFQEFSVYDCRVQPNKDDEPSTARLPSFYIHYTQYAERWDEIYALLSKEAVQGGSLDRFRDTVQPQRGALTVGAAFLRNISDWRESLARDIAARNPAIMPRDLNYTVQITINRIIFLRICEDKSIERAETLKGILAGGRVGMEGVREEGYAYRELVRLFRAADEKYNSGLFHFTIEHNLHEPTDSLTLGLSIGNAVLDDIIRHLYFPFPYKFDVIPVEILGQVYEQFLGKVIVRATDGSVQVEEKPEVRKAGGVYYTPSYIVDYIVEHTVGKLLDGRTAEEASRLRIVDPACGSGSFLIGAYSWLLRWYLAYYRAHDPAALARKRGINRPVEAIPKGSDNYRLTLAERKRILKNNLFGVDIDRQAVEVTKLSLMLKVLEGEGAYTGGQERFVWEPEAHERILPDLADNIKCGNSLIGSDFYATTQATFLDMEEAQRINAFDWAGPNGFPQVMRDGGFDAVIGNPPYVDSEWMTQYDPHTREYCVPRYTSASGNWDLFCVFIEKAIDLCKVGGFSSFIVPNKLAAAEYAAGARRVITSEAHLISVRDYSRVPVFPVSVYPIVYRVHKQEQDTAVTVERMIQRGVVIECIEAQNLDYVRYFSNPTRPWPIFSGINEASPIERLQAEYPQLSQIAQVLGAATVAEAYDIAKLITEGEDDFDTALSLANSGTIDRYSILWGKKPMRYLGSSYLRPVIAKEHISDLPITRLQQAKTPKIIIAGMTLVLECAVDLSGGLLAGKSTTIITTTSLDLRYLLALLNSKLIAFYYRSVYGGNTLQGGYLRIGPPQLRTIPIRTIDPTNPADKQQHDAIVAHVDRMLTLHKQLAATLNPHDKAFLQTRIAATDTAIDRLVYTLYGLTEEEIQVVEGAG